MSIKNYKDTIGNRISDLPACSAVPQPTAPPRTTYTSIKHFLLGMCFALSVNGVIKPTVIQNNRFDVTVIKIYDVTNHCTINHAYSML